VFHVEFEDELSISVMKYTATRWKFYNWGDWEFLKKVKPPAHFIWHPAFFKLSCALQSIKTWRTGACRSC
jgi:hypothetical protein